VTVPGAVDAWCALHERFGRLSLAEVLAPAIGYAREGFPVSEVIAHYWGRNCHELASIPGFASVYMPGGRAPLKGEIFRNPGLARTYEAIGAQGRKAFYQGAIANDVARAVREAGGYLSVNDFTTHHGDWAEPISARYRGHDVWQMPPNTQGLAALQMLNLLEGFDLRNIGYASADYPHLLIEAKKLAFEDRARYYADPEHSAVPTEALLSRAYAAQRRELIDLARVAERVEAGDPRADRSDTIYLATADNDGNMVSLIQSNYRGMGCGITPPGLGFVLQNRGASFSLDAADPNGYAPGKRPFHTIMPSFVTRLGKPWLAFGVMGGSMQPQGQVQVLVNLIDFDMNLQQAGDAARLRHEGSSEPNGTTMRGSGVVHIEVGAPEEWATKLAARGHSVNVIDDGDYGGYQAIAVRGIERTYVGASESRKDGAAMGF